MPKTPVQIPFVSLSSSLIERRKAVVHFQYFLRSMSYKLPASIKRIPKTNMSHTRMPADVAGPLVTEKPKTLRQMLQETTTASPSVPALVSMYQSAARFSNRTSASKTGDFLTWTYQELDEKAEMVASSMFARGLRPGMRLAVCLPNGVEWALLFRASVKMGAIFVPLDERAVPRKDEMHHYLEVVKPSALFIASEANARTLLKENLRDLDTIPMKVILEPAQRPLTGWGDFDDLLAKESGANILSSPHHSVSIVLGADYCFSDSLGSNYSHKSASQRTESEMDAILYICFTSGSSGLPKACPLSNKNSWAQAIAGKGSTWATAVAGSECNPRDRKRLIVSHAPPSHSMGIRNMIGAWINGATVVVPSPVFEATTTLRAINEMKCTHMSGE